MKELANNLQLNLLDIPDDNISIPPLNLKQNYHYLRRFKR